VDRGRKVVYNGLKWGEVGEKPDFYLDLTVQVGDK
jgi:hypothetical protein